MKKLKEILFLSDKGYTDLKKAIIACTITNLAMLLPFCITVMVFSELLNPFLGQELDWQNIWLLWGAGIISAIIVFLASKNDYRKTYIASYKESNVTRLRIAEHLRKLPMSFFNTKDLSELTTNMMSDCSSMESMLSSTIPPLIANGISVTLTCVLLALFDWRLALCVFITLPIAFLVIWCSRKYQIKLFEKQVETKLNASSQVQEYLEGIKIIKSCNLSGVHFRTLNRALLEMKKIAVKVEMVVGIFMSSASMILQAGIGITIFVGTILLVNGQIELLPLLMFFLIVTKIYGPILAILSQLTTLLNLNVVTERMKTLLTTPAMSGKEETPQTYNIKLNDVSFAYNNEDVIHNVSCTIPQGSITALVGPSGSGKSTIAKLIARFWDIQSGSITIGNKNIKTINPENLMEKMSFVFQDVTLFNDTVFNNIQMGNPNATKEQVYKAAKVAYCDEFVRNLPNGYDTILGENGSTLSGGERQRISIARALLKDSPIILLDEATASLDPENEVFVQNNYFKGGVGKSKLSTMFAYLTDKFNLKVLMIDKDLQATLTKDLAKTFKVELPRVNFYEGLKNGNLASSIVHLTDNLDLIPGTFDLMLLPKLTRSWTFENESRLLATLLAPLKSDYDLIIIDTVPTPSVYTNNAIVASDYVMIPLQAEEESTNNIQNYISYLIDLQEQFNPGLDMIGFVPYLVDTDSATIKSNLEELYKQHKEDNLVFQNIIKRSNKVSTWSKNGITEHKGYDKKVLSMYENVFFEMLERIIQLENEKE